MVMTPVAGNDRNAPVKRIASGSAARIRIAVQSDINTVISRVIVRRIPFPIHPVKRQTAVQQPLIDPVALRHIVKNASFQKEARRGNPPQDFSPSGKHLLRHLVKLVQAAKGHMPRPLKRRRRDRAQRRVKGRIAEMTVGKAQELFGKKGFFPGKGRRFIRQKIIHSRKPRRRKVADAGKLHRRRTVRQHGQEIISRMPCQINQDVDLVLIDYPGGLCRRKAAKIAPAVRHCG